MKPGLQPGVNREFRFVVPASKTVPALYPEAAEFSRMPAVFATGFLVGLLEWTCMQALRPWLDEPAELTLGTHIDVSHCAATPPGREVTVQATLVEVRGRRLRFEVEAHDGVELISRGHHARAVVDRARFLERVAGKSVT